MAQLEAKLESEISTTNPELAGLQRKAVEMARYYYKGFGHAMVGIAGRAERSLHHEDANLATESYTLFGKIEKFYAAIPFPTLQESEEFYEFYPLFIVRRLLPQFREHMNQIFQEKEKKAFMDLDASKATILSIGSLYREALVDTLKKIRSFSEAKEFRVAIPDQLKDHTWYF